MDVTFIHKVFRRKFFIGQFKCSEKALHMFLFFS